MKNKKYSFRFLVAWQIILLVAIYMNPAISAENHIEGYYEQRQGGTLTIGVLIEPDVLDPHYTSTFGTVRILNNIYNGILKLDYRDKRLYFEPDLAESWERLDDLTYIFRLRKNVKFHDGRTFTAADVIYSINRVRDEKTKSPHAWKLSLLKSIEAKDDYTILMKFSEPYPFLRVALTGSTGRAGTIVDKDWIERLGMKARFHPMGTGPFKFIEYKENDHITLERNPDYFEHDSDGKQLPYLDKVIWKILPDPAVAISALKAGQVDGLDFVPYQFVQSLKADPKFTLYSTPGGNWTHLTFNLRKPPFDDKFLRQAISYAIDRDAIVRQVYFGEAVVAHGPISPPMSDFYDADYESGNNGQYYNLDKAKELIAKSKYPNGVEAEFLVRNDGEWPQMGVAIQEQLKKIGVTLNIKLVDVASFNQRWKASDFSVFTWHWEADLDPDETLYPELHTNERWNLGGYSNTEFDTLVTNARKTNDINVRRENYRKAQDILAEDVPVAVLTHKNEHKIFASKVKGFVQIPADLMDLHRVWIAKTVEPEQGTDNAEQFIQFKEKIIKTFADLWK
ncbi:MAG: ABC transporter substrate-binding protein [Methylococcales bacterium]|nr:ABC transporter substrate-binding protein [Methylococcales bacterium]